MTTTATTTRPDGDLPRDRVLLGLLGLVVLASLVVGAALLDSVVRWLPIVPISLIYVIGAFIVLRTNREHHRIGWLLATSGLFSSTFVATPVFEATGATWAGVLEALAGFLLLPLLLAILLYPTGRAESLPLRVLVVVMVVGVTATNANWLAINLGWTTSDRDPLDLAVAASSLPLLLSFAEQIRIYRRRPLEQQKQVKWYVLGLLTAPAYLVPIVLGWSDEAFFAVDAATTLLFPIAILVGITRYRLYDIDRLVSRTVAYTLVVGLLAALGVATVGLVTTLLPVQDQLAVALTTVAVVALFDPLRRRVVRAIDRRFDRAHYEAELVVQEFGRGVRDTTDLGEVRDQLDDVLARTVAPATVAVWQPTTEVTS